MRAVKKYLFLIAISAALLLGASDDSKAQSIELVAGNTLNGAMNGVLLGGATMALKNDEDFRPVEIGLGAGTLYGLGVGLYDISQINSGQQFYLSGTFNDGTNSSIIVLLDTFYGAAGGALVGASISLIIKEPVLNALQYGSGIGAWAGFGFGLFDAFMLAKGPNDYSSQAAASTGSDISGLLTYTNASESVSVGLFSPSFVKQKKVSARSINTTYSPSFELLQLQLDF